jgi:MFS family permease
MPSNVPPPEHAALARRRVRRQHPELLRPAVLGALLEPIRKEFHLSGTQLGALGTFPIVLYALVGLPLGRLADSTSRKRLLAAARPSM